MRIQTQTQLNYRSKNADKNKEKGYFNRNAFHHGNTFEKLRGMKMYQNLQHVSFLSRNDAASQKTLSTALTIPLRVV